MAILHVDTRRRVLWRCAAPVAAAIALGAVLYGSWPAADRGTHVGAASPQGGIARCCANATAHPAPLLRDPGPVAAPSPPGTPLPGGDALYRQALRYLGCQALAESEPTAPDQSYQFDPSGALAARIERDAQARREPCRMLGPHEYRQVEALMRQAAQQGDRDAAFFLLERDVRATVDRVASARAQEQPVDSRELAAGLAQVDAMAQQGHRDAMVLVAQLMAAGQAGPPDPVGAAAWSLVALELDMDRPASQDDLENSGILSSLTENEAQVARQRAAALRRACCESMVSAHGR